MNKSRVLEALRNGAVDAFAASRYYGGGKGGNTYVAPPAPDYSGAAVAQSDASKQIATQQTAANRPNLYTPWGSQTWSSYAATDPATGQPVTQWQSNINLSPDQQAALDAQQRIGAGRSQAAQTLLGQATSAFQTPFDWQGLPDAPGNLSDAQSEAYKKMSALVEPGRQEQRAALDTKLANMGLGMGTESTAASRARRDQADQFARQDSQLLSQALSEGRSDAGTQQQLRQAGIAEEAQRRGMTLNELNALLTGQQVSMPQMPGFSQASAGQAPNLLGAAQAAGNYGLQAAQLNQQNQQNTGMDWGSLIGTGAQVAMMFSDARLKSKLRRIATHRRGIGIYRYEIFGREEVGVLAQEVLQVAPHLVVMTPSGYLAVNYGGL